MRRVTLLSALFLVLSMVLPAATGSTVAAQPPDFDISDGHFYTQMSGEGEGGIAGYSITNDADAPLWTLFQTAGGTDRLGYPISRRFLHNGLISQATQRFVLQYDGYGLRYLNVFEELSAMGLDEVLEQKKRVPRPAKFDDDGLPSDRFVQARLALLDANPAIKGIYWDSYDPIGEHGLPVSQVEDMGRAYVIRNQRDAIQQWKNDEEWARAGEITMVDGGSIARDFGLVPQEAAELEYPPGVPYFPLSAQGLSWEPNCGLTAIKLYVTDRKDRPLNGIYFHIESADGSWSAVSEPTGADSYDFGVTDLILRDQPVEEPWRLWATTSTGFRLSDTIVVHTSQESCKPDGWGRQVASLWFQQKWPIVFPEFVVPYGSGEISWEASCAETRLNFRVSDPDGNPIDGIRIRGQTEGETWTVDSKPTGTTDQGPGMTNIWLRGEPFKLRLNVFVTDERGNPMSDMVMVDTEDWDCSTTGLQVATINFVRK